MKTTVEVPDKLYRQVKALAALRGQTMKAFFVDALRDKVITEKDKDKNGAGWMSVFGKAKKEDMEKLQRYIDAEFSHIDPEDWK
jgi:metal-responsive CopG/Arc/MetJ family transcriptional regulator